MKKLSLLVYLIAVVCLLSLNIYSQKAKSAKLPKFDAELAKKLGADEYGMKQYVMVFLKYGTATVSKDERDKIFTGHLKNIMRLAEAGKLIVAGPFMEDKDIAGIFIFDVKTIQEAQKLLETDPAVKAGLLVPELHSWYGSAALMEIPQLHKVVQKKSIVN